MSRYLSSIIVLLIQSRAKIAITCIYPRGYDLANSFVSTVLVSVSIFSIMQQSDVFISDEASSHYPPGHSSSWNPAFRPDSDQSPEIHNDKADILSDSIPDGSSNSQAERVNNAESRAVSRTTHSTSHQDISHVSSLSFARTVSHDGFWADEDENEPIWEASPIDAAFASISQSQNRTNSFPDVPPLHQAPSVDTSTSDPLLNGSSFGMDQPSTSLSKDIEYKDEDFMDGKGMQDEFGTAGSGQPPNVLFAGSKDGALAGSLANRYEEGIPLVNSTSFSEQEVETPEDPFAGSAAEEDDFFRTDRQPLDLDSQPTQQPELQRKSTSQVIGALKYPSHEDAHRNEHEDSQSPIKNSSSPHLSEIVEKRAFSSDENRRELEVSENVSPNGEAKEDDLAEKWKAALDDDEMLESTDEGTDPAPFFEDDGEGFLEDDIVPDLSTKQPIMYNQTPYQQSGQNGHLRRLNGLATVSHSALNSQYKLAEPLVSNTASSRTDLYGNNPGQASLNQEAQTFGQPALRSFSARMNAPGGVNTGQYGIYQAVQPPSRPEVSKAQSFADKSKGGYSSPYDLPMDVIKPRKRQSMQQLGGHYQFQSNFPPDPLPPRATPYSSQPPTSSTPYSRQLPSTGAATTISPPRSSSSNAPFMKQANTTMPAPGLKPKSSTSSFFEELPMVPKARPIHSSGRNSSQGSSLNQATYQQPSPSDLSPASMAMPPPPASRVSSTTYPTSQLQAPERVSPYSQTPQQPPAPLPTGTSSRYSPAPSLPRSNYTSPSKATISTGTYSQPNSLPHQPRTSSPLAHPHRPSIAQQSPSVVHPEAPLSSVYQQDPQAQQNDQSQRPGSSPSYDHGLLLPKDYNDALNMQEPQEHSKSNTGAPSTGTAPNRYAPKSSSQGLQRVASSSSFVAPPKLNRASSNYAPVSRGNSSFTDSSFAPPQRSQTQSPGNMMIPGPKVSSMPQDPYQRPASVHDPTSPTSGSFSYPTMPQQSTANRVRAFSQSLNLIVPTDGREHDPLQRWKGCPTFSWGFGGSIVSCFPSESPMYTAGQAMLKRGLGEVKVRNARSIIPLAEHTMNFPGPLKAKSKKKEVILWLSKRIEQLEREIPGFRPSHSSPDSLGEKILLWKVMRTLVENDGMLEGNSELEKNIRALIIPGLNDQDSELQLGSIGTGTQVSNTAIAEVMSDSRSSDALNVLRKLLLAGEREKSVWHAADQRLWAHAMLISSTMNRDIWKNVSREFISKEVQSLGHNTESLAALYEVFAGNWDESVDKLVHPSARMGVQMLSTPGNAPKDALEGLSKWRETLGLVVSNRSPEDSKALHALGRLLESYDRVDAAHTCYIFGRSAASFGPSEDPQTAFSLIGAKQSPSSPADVDEMDPILLSEVYEFALSLGIVANASAAPHLQAYKLYHALVLAEYGFRSEAQQYCNAIANTIKSSTKSSPYFNAVLVNQLEDLSQRLQHSPQDGTSSWVSKPSMEKVSGAFSAKFYSFISGDDSDAASTGSGREASDVGPFARIAGNTPPITPNTSNTSNTNLYDGFNPPSTQPYSTGRQSPAAAIANARYAPSGAYHPYQPNRSSLERQRSSTDSPRTSVDRGVPQTAAYGMYDSINSQSSLYPGPTYESAHQSLASPLGPMATSPTSPQYPSQGASSVHTNIPYNPHNQSEYASESPSTGPSYKPSALSNEYPTLNPNNRHEPASAISSQEPSGYEPPSYEPPSYQPYHPEEQTNDEAVDESKSRKKSIMDLDDDDDAADKTAEAKSKAEKDREAEENFRKAAEADGK
jgi:hypothetical protein